jgi:hypothetical protein
MGGGFCDDADRLTSVTDPANTIARKPGFSYDDRKSGISHAKMDAGIER